MASQLPRADEAAFCSDLSQITMSSKISLIFQSLSSDPGAIQHADGQLIDLQACKRSTLPRDASHASASALIN